MPVCLKHPETGIMTAAFIAVKAGFAKLPQALTCRSLLGYACLAGTGFTVSLFVAISLVLFWPELSAW